MSKLYIKVCDQLLKYRSTNYSYTDTYSTIINLYCRLESLIALAICLFQGYEGKEIQLIKGLARLWIWRTATSFTNFPPRVVRLTFSVGEIQMVLRL